MLSQLLLLITLLKFSHGELPTEFSFMGQTMEVGHGSVTTGAAECKRKFRGTKSGIQQGRSIETFIPTQDGSSSSPGRERLSPQSRSKKARTGNSIGLSYPKIWTEPRNQEGTLKKLILAQEGDDFLSEIDHWLTLQPANHGQIEQGSSSHKELRLGKNRLSSIQKMEYETNTVASIDEEMDDKTVASEVKGQSSGESKASANRRALETKDMREGMRRSFLSIWKINEIQKRKLKDIKFSRGTETAFEIFSRNLQTIKQLSVQRIYTIFFGRYSESILVKALDDDLGDEILTRLGEPVVNSLKTLLFNLQERRTKKTMELIHDQEASILSALNYLGKYNLAKKIHLQDFMNEEEVHKILPTHIGRAFPPSLVAEHLYLNADLKTSLLKSESNEHMHFLLNLCNEEIWEKIEFHHLKNQIGHLKKSAGDLADYPIMSEFVNAGFAKTLKVVPGSTEPTFEERVQSLGKNLAAYLNLPQHEEALKKRRLCVYKMVHDILLFFMRYGNKILPEKCLARMNSPIFYQRIKTYDAAVHLLSDTINLRIVVTKGLWTTDMDSSRSRHSVVLAKAHELPFLLLPETRDSSKEFRLYFNEDMERWHSKMELVARRMGSNEKAPLLDVISELTKWQNRRVHGQSSYKFGTNFPMATKEDLDQQRLKIRRYKHFQSSKQYVPTEPRAAVCWDIDESTAATSFPTEMKISRVFLEDVYLWVDRVKRFLDQWTLQNWNLISERRKLSDLGAKYRENNSWYDDSVMLQTIDNKINRELDKTRQTWHRFVKSFHILNRHIDDGQSSRGRQWTDHERNLISQHLKWEPGQAESPLPLPNLVFRRKRDA